MRAYVGVTDGEWYRFLAARDATEVNFWQPSGGRRFGAVERGAPFLFKTHYGDEVSNQIVGVGFFSGSVPLPVSRAWEIFGEGNGCADEIEMRRRISKYRRAPIGPAEDPEIGCIMLHDVVFAEPADALPAPADWPKNIVQGKSYDLTEPGGSVIEQMLEALLARHGWPDDTGSRLVPGAVYGQDRLARVRVGQRAFQALVLDSYGRRCAVTGDKIVPVLEAAHIRGVSRGGENRVDNGLLLRSDVHTLFDRGYLSVHPDRLGLMVSRRLRSDFGNGEEFYAREASGATITLPKRRVDRPAREFLEWHADTLFKAS